MPLDVERLAYKPFEYPWAYEAWLTQNRIHWLPEEVPLAEDVKDWQKNLTPGEKNLLTQIFRLFTQSDVEVGNCLPGHAEILTEKGWVRFDELSHGIRVGQVHPDRTLSFVSPLNIVRLQHTGEMHTVSNKTGTFSLQTTEDHDWVFSTVSDKETLRKRPIRDLELTSNLFFHTTAPRRDEDGLQTSLTDWERLLIAYEADGAKGDEYLTEDGYRLRFEFSRNEKIERLTQLLEKLGLKYNIHASKKNTTIFYVFHQGPRPIRDFGWINLSLVSANWCREFIEELTHWDGHRYDHHNTFSTTRPESASIVDAIRFMAGYRGHASYSENSGRKSWSVVSRSKYVPSCANTMTRVVERVENQPVFCVTVPTGMIAVRYGRTTHVTGNCYNRFYMNIFKPPEVMMMLGAFSAMESVHIAAYSHLLDTIGMPETEYQAFLEYDEMKAKYDFMREYRGDDPEAVALTLAAFGAFTEGLQLFASFAILLNFSRFNKMKGMGQIVTWSARDETLHAVNVIRLFHTYLSEHPEVHRDVLAKKLYDMCKTVVTNEDKFIDLAFAEGDVEGLTKEEVKKYIRYMADVRLLQLGLSPIYNIAENPLPWMDTILNGIEHAAFFEQRATEYSKASTQGDWSDVFGEVVN
jgi:ribonucleoside-diphosphate reductase beta chain